MKRIVYIAIVWSLPLSQMAFGQCQPGETEIAISLLTDSYGYETAWTLTDQSGLILAQGGQGGVYASDSLYGDTLCVDTSACLTFRISDTFGDGMCCGFGQGWYQIHMNGVLVTAGGDFGTESVESFNCPPGSGCNDPLIANEGVHTAPQTDTWYSFTPSQNGSYSIEACDNNCDTKIWIYEYCSGLNWAESNVGTIYYDDDQGGCGPQAMLGSTLLEGGTEYWIRIGSDLGDCTGSINWSLTYNGPIEGCTDPTACNYNPLATVSDTCIYPGSPGCPDGPDLIVDVGALSSSLYMSSMNVAANDCRVEEGCMNGYGLRDIIRFTTHIKNIGNLDYYIGSPGANPDQFDFVNCHNHTHYKGYAEYKLFDTDGVEIPIGFKNGFCVMDLECSGGGSAQYGCSIMGISAGCGDIYSSGLDCQWIDVTDVDTGLYTFVNTANWDNDPDALGRYELDTLNNWAQLCIYIGRDTAGNMYVDQVADCNPYFDCLGQLYGSAQPDCEGICAGTALRGDINTDATQNVLDAHSYVSEILANTISPAECSDLNADGDIDVYDAALMVDCSLTNDGHVTGSAHDHCNFPYGVTNIFDTVQLSIGEVNLAQQYVDIYIRNPYNFVSAYQFELAGLQIQSVENLIDPTVYPITPEWTLGGSEVIGISYLDSLVPKFLNPTPLCRIHYFALTDTTVCISEIKTVVNQNYEETVTTVDSDSGCASVVTDVEELADGGVKLELFPNPMSDFATLRVQNRYSADLSGIIMDPTGKTVQDIGVISSNSVRIERENLSAGMYFVQLFVGNRPVAREKFVVQ